MKIDVTTAERISMTVKDLIERTNYSLATEGLSLSSFGKDEMTKRWNKKEAEGGFPQATKDSEYVNTSDKTPLQVWEEAQEKRSENLL